MKKPVLFIALAFITLWSCKPESTAPAASTTSETMTDYASEGQVITKAVFARLSKELMAAINADGPSGAIDYCQINALPITDSVATAFGVTVQRVTDRARNPLNKADSDDINIMSQYRAAIAASEELKGKVLNQDNQHIYYAPIRINGLCLQCHGSQDTDISSETLTTIQSKYPEDQATGYVAGDLRGLWKVSFRD